MSYAKVKSILGDEQQTEQLFDRIKPYLLAQKSLLNHIIFLTVLAENAINKNLFKNAIYFFEYALNLCDPDELPYRYKIIKLRYDEIKFKIPESSISLDIKKSVAHEKILAQLI